MSDNDNDKTYKASEMLKEWCGKVKCQDCPCFLGCCTPESRPGLWRKLVLPNLPRPGRVVDDLDDLDTQADRETGTIRMIQDDAPVATAPTVEGLDDQIDQLARNNRFLDDALTTLVAESERARVKADRHRKILGYIGAVVFGLGIYQVIQLASWAIEKIAAGMGW